MSEISPTSPGPAARPGCLGGSGQLHAQHGQQSCTTDFHRQLLCLSGGKCPLVYYIPLRTALQWQWKRKKSKQQARLFHYLTSQLLTMVLFLPSRWAAATTPVWAQLKNSMKMPPRPQRGEQARPSPPGTRRTPLPRIPPGASSTPPHLVLRWPQPGVTSHWRRALAAGQLSSAARQKLIKSN